MGNLDEALQRFHVGHLEYAGGLANHGPMAAEALERLGHQALIPAFLGLYAPRLPIAEKGRTLSEDEASEALGEIARAADWVATYETRLEKGDWRSVVAASVPKLIPGLFAGAGHGFLRTAHALRSLEACDSPLRRRELAHGLAYWSARYRPLPGRLGCGALRPTEGLASLADWPQLGEAVSRVGFLSDSVRRLDSFPEFSEAIERLALPEPTEVDAFLGGLCSAAASLYIDHPDARIVYVHALTIPSAARLVAAYLSEAEACLLAAAVFQATLAIHSIYGEKKSAIESDSEVDRISGNWDEIRYHAACSLDEHAIKMVEACWREYQIHEDPVFMRAAADAALKIDARGRIAAC
ncbi:MAG: hypothetical protein VCB25_10710 [Myxococcota bacterium]